MLLLLRPISNLEKKNLDMSIATAMELASSGEYYGMRMDSNEFF
jgi:hypothetical protein